MELTNTNRPNLFAMLDAYEQGTDDLNAIVAQSKVSPEAAITEVEQGLTSLQGIDALVDRINEGESGVSQARVQDMFEFYTRRVNEKVEEKAEQIGLIDLPPIRYENDEWQFVATEVPDNKEKQFVDYLNKDNTLSTELQKVSRLSEVNELALSQQYATQLKEQGTEESVVSDYLLNTRDQLNASRFIGVTNGELSLANVLISKSGFEKLNGESSNG